MLRSITGEAWGVGLPMLAMSLAMAAWLPDQFQEAGIMLLLISICCLLAGVVGSLLLGIRALTSARWGD